MAEAGSIDVQVGTSAATDGKARRSRSFSMDPLLSLALAAALVAITEIAARFEYVSPLILPAPSLVAATLWDGLISGYYLPHILSTSSSLIVGFLIGTAIALAVGGLLASSPRLENILTPFIVAFQSMPKVAIAPLIVIWLGFGEVAKTAIVVTVCFFPMMVNTLQGLKVRDRVQYELFQSLGASRWQVFLHLRLPTAVPYIFAGLHIGAIFALIGAVVAEFVGTGSGIGYAMLQAKAAFDVPGVYVCLFLLMILGTLLNYVMKKLEKRISFWMPDVSRVST
jgi:NitT/TauT family transport system permease protein